MHTEPAGKGGVEPALAAVQALSLYTPLFTADGVPQQSEKTSREAGILRSSGGGK